MREPVDLVLFTHLVGKPDSELDLERAALLVAETEYPALDVATYVAKMDALGALARQRIAERGLESLTVESEGLGSEEPGEELGNEGLGEIDRMLPVLDLLYKELGFRGNVSDYYDPRNSFLNDVIDRRVGIPITLAIVLLAVCRRAGVEAHGVSFPGHFLVSTRGRGGCTVFIDPFDGQVLDPAQLRSLYEQATGDPGDLDDRYLRPATRRQIVARMLNNLRAIYEVRGDRDRLQQVLERMAVVSPSDEVKTRLALLTQTASVRPRLSIN